jgi:hypothetical protein
MSYLVKERGLKREAADRLLETVREAPFLADASIRRDGVRGDSRIDFVCSIRAATFDRRLVCEVKSSGQPRIARVACLDLVEYARSDKRDYPVFIAPYISSEAASICEGYGSAISIWRATAAWHSIRFLYGARVIRTLRFKSGIFAPSIHPRRSEFFECS